MYKYNDNETPEHDKMQLMFTDRDYVCEKFPVFDDPIIQLEDPIKNKQGDIIGYWDAKVFEKKTIERSICKKKYWVYRYVEIKPEVISFGTTLRQINRYRAFIPPFHPLDYDVEVCLFTPDTKLKKAFATQGIRVIQP